MCGFAIGRRAAICVRLRWSGGAAAECVAYISSQWRATRARRTCIAPGLTRA